MPDRRPSIVPPKCRAAESRALKAHANDDEGDEDDADAPARLAPRSKRMAHVIAAGCVMTVAVALLFLSLAHLSQGVTLLTNSSALDGLLMAVGIDLSFLSLEAALIVADDATRPAVGRYAVPSIIGTLAISGAMNALASDRTLGGSWFTPRAPWGWRSRC